jgi:PmbA protein
MNSSGVAYGYSTTSVSAQIMSVAEDGSDSQTGWDFRTGRFLSDVSFRQVGASAARHAVSLLGARRMSARKAPVLLHSSVAASFLSVLASMLSSEAVQKGKSLLKGKLGQTVVSNMVDIVDDGLMPHGPGTRHIDDEGVPVRRTELVREGVLHGLMYNTLTAARDGVASTGNAVKGGVSALPAVRPINLYLGTSGKRFALEEMLSNMQGGLYVLDAMGVHTANPVSGEFSIGVSGLWVEGGEVKHPVKEAVISGNLLEFFGRVEAVGKDLRFYGKIGSPSLLFGQTDISA